MIGVSLMAVIGIALYPESPQTLINNGRYTDARRLLEKFMDDDDEIITKIQNWGIKKTQKYELKIVFKQKTWIEKLIPLFGLIIFDSLLGVTVMLFYLKPIIEATGKHIKLIFKIYIFSFSFKYLPLYIFFERGY